MSHSRRLFFKQGAALFGATLLTNKINVASALVKGVQHIEADKELLLYHSHGLRELVSRESLSEFRSLMAIEPGYGLLLDTGGLFFGNKDQELSLNQVDVVNSLRIKASLLGAEYLNMERQKFAKLVSKLDFPLVNCNYVFKDSSLKAHVMPYVVYKTKMKTIGITGVGRILSSADVEVQDPIVAANRMAAFLKNQKSCDLVICLTDVEMNREMAEQSLAIDFILGASEIDNVKQARVARNRQKEEVILTTACQEFISKSVVLFDENGQRIGFEHRHLMCSDPYARNGVVLAKMKQIQPKEAQQRPSMLG